MLSNLWSACADGDLNSVAELLSQGSQVDLEARDHNGNTPLIEAVKNNNVEVVRLLLDKGADPTNASSQGLPEHYTSDPAILELLTAARTAMASQSAPVDPAYSQDANIDATRAYYPPPPGPYYYPGMPMPPPMLPDGSMPFYMPPPPHAAMPDMSGAGIGNLPPPEISRRIPCRYYPACRFGTSCMFAHPPPPQGPYVPAPMPPPAQYPPAPYDGMPPPAPYPPTYYPVPPPSFQTPSPAVPVNPVSPSLSPTVSVNGHHMPAPRPTGEMISPVQPTFTPGGVPPPVPYGAPGPAPYGPGAPMPLAAIPPLPVSGPQSPQVVYPPTSPLVHTNAPYPIPPGYLPQPYPPASVIPNGVHIDAATSPKSPSMNPQPDYYASGHRESFSNHRRGGGRRPSFGVSRKPPCMFFPSGRCKNGDDCRFPHILPDGTTQPTGNHLSSRGGHRPRPSLHTNGVTGLEEKFATLNTQDSERPRQDAPPAANGNGTNGHASTGSSRSQSTEPGSGSRGRGFQGFKNTNTPLSNNNNSNNNINGHRPDKKAVAPLKPQRLPSADEFPVLAGAATPPLRSPGATGKTNGWAGPTAAQVLQAPAPARKDSQPSTRGGSPDQFRPVVAAQTPKEGNGKPEANGNGNGLASPVSVSSKLAASLGAVTVTTEAVAISA